MFCWWFDIAGHSLLYTSLVLLAIWPVSIFQFRTVCQYFWEMHTFVLQFHIFSYRAKILVHTMSWSVPSHYLNQCWQTVNWSLGNKSRLNLDQSTIFIQQTEFENIICTMAAILSLLPCVNNMGCLLDIKTWADCRLWCHLRAAWLCVMTSQETVTVLSANDSTDKIVSWLVRRTGSDKYHISIGAIRASSLCAYIT